MPAVKIINDDASIASTLTASTASDTPRRRKPSVRKRDTRLQPDDKDQDKGQGTKSLHRQRTIDNIATWVSRRVSVRSLSARKTRAAYRDTDSESYYSAPCTDTDDEGLADSYAAFCRAFTAGHSEYNYHEHYHQRRSHSGSYRERRSRLRAGDCEGFREDGELPDEEEDGPVGSFRMQQDRALDAAAHSTAEGSSLRDRLGERSQLPLAVRASDEDHDPHLAQSSPLGAYNYASLPPPPISPPPRILTPAIYAETQRAAAQERQWTQSREGHPMEKDSQWGRGWKGFRGWWRGKRMACW
ncbi:hypothetical protein HFD88_003595 [Aspergillus terreus]|nr:hypothetical protein HFD88_003595 [Aspergillus terreus]